MLHRGRVLGMRAGPNCDMMSGEAEFSANPKAKMKGRAIHLASMVLYSQTETEINAVRVLSIVNEKKRTAPSLFKGNDEKTPAFSCSSRLQKNNGQGRQPAMHRASGSTCIYIPSI